MEELALLKEKLAVEKVKRAEAEGRQNQAELECRRCRSELSDVLAERDAAVSMASLYDHRLTRALEALTYDISDLDKSAHSPDQQTALGRIMAANRAAAAALLTDRNEEHSRKDLFLAAFEAGWWECNPSLDEGEVAEKAEEAWCRFTR